MMLQASCEIDANRFGQISHSLSIFPLEFTASIDRLGSLRNIPYCIIKIAAFPRRYLVGSLYLSQAYASSATSDQWISCIRVFGHTVSSQAKLVMMQVISRLLPSLPNDGSHNNTHARLICGKSQLILPCWNMRSQTQHPVYSYLPM